ncbi:ParB/RepB/Spo0J family partition protein [Coprothermobacteraceae bacterium]|nr:ParB/RepB/Spo0J family partition protein [Coprothermobacteraceae bacterium]
MSKSKLGKGLGALLGDALTGEEIIQLDPSLIVPSPFQPRYDSGEDIEELAESVKHTGILQPILVRDVGEKYELIAGERRWRAAMLAGLEKVPVIVKNVNDDQAMVMALVENVQRKDLSPIQVAKAAYKVIQHTGVTQEELAETLGMSRPTLTNLLRLLELPEEVQLLLDQNSLSVGHAKVLLGLEDKNDIIKLARIAVERQISVRQLEQLVKMREAKARYGGKDPKLSELRNAFKRVNFVPIKVSKGKHGYSVTLNFSDPEAAKKFAQLLSSWEL